MDCTILATSSCNPTPVLGVHGINKKNRFFMLKKPIFILVLGFHDPTSRFGPILKTLHKSVRVLKTKLCLVCFCKGTFECIKVLGLFMFESFIIVYIYINRQKFREKPQLNFKWILNFVSYVLLNF